MVWWIEHFIVMHVDKHMYSSFSSRLRILFVVTVVCGLPSVAFTRPAPPPLIGKPRPKTVVRAATPPTVSTVLLSSRASLPVQRLLPAPRLGVALKRPFRSHAAFLSVRLKNAKRIRKRQFRREMAARLETYPRRFNSGLPSAKRYRIENPAAKPQKIRRPQRIGGQAPSRHFVRFEGDTLVVRERLLSSGVPNPKLPIVHELAFGPSSHPYRVTVSGNRVIVFGSYPEVRSFIVDTAGQLSESRGFSIGATVSVVRGDYVAFAITPPMPSRHNPHQVLHPLPTVHVIDGPTASTMVSLPEWICYRSEH